MKSRVAHFFLAFALGRCHCRLKSTQMILIRSKSSYPLLPELLVACAPAAAARTESMDLLEASQESTVNSFCSKCEQRGILVFVTVSKHVVTLWYIIIQEFRRGDDSPRLLIPIMLAKASYAWTDLVGIQWRLGDPRQIRRMKLNQQW
jgi:hypothetical protein